MAIVNFPFSHRPSQTLPSPTVVNHSGFTVSLPAGSAWPGASAQLLINLGGAGCILGHLTTSSSVRNSQARPFQLHQASHNIPALSCGQSCQERTLKTRVKNNRRKPKHPEVPFPNSIPQSQHYLCAKAKRASAAQV